MKYIVEINMADAGEPQQWEVCYRGEFNARAHAENAIEWMLVEYGDTIEFRVVEAV